MAVVRVFAIVAAALVAIHPAALRAALDYSSIGSVHTENFNELAATGISLAWANDSTLPGWYLYRIQSDVSVTPPVPITSYDASDGSGRNANFYSFGPSAGNPADRALGGIGGGRFGGSGNVPFGEVVGWIAFGVTNTTGSQLTQFSVNFAGEQWHDGGNGAEAHTMVFEYGFGSTFDSVGTWTAPGGDFDWDSPIATTTLGAVDGNAAGRVPDRGGTIADEVWESGSTLWLRWIELNDAGLDHGLAIDDFSFTAKAAAVPEPGAYVFGVLALGLVAGALAIRRVGMTKK